MNRRPNVTNETAAKVAQNVFGLTNIQAVKELCSFYDCNFFLKTPPKQYVLKVLNSYDSQHKEEIEAEAKAMQFLTSQGFPCPEMYTSKQTKEHMALVEFNGVNPETNNNKTKELCIVRLLGFLEGKMACSIDRNPELLYTIGSFVGRLSNVLKDFSHEGIKSRTSQPFLWNILEFLNIDRYIRCFNVDDKDPVSLIREVHAAFVNKVKPRLQVFRYGTVHNDLNGENILVTGPPYVVSGVIDFGDMVESLTISDLSNAMAFVMQGDRGIEFSGYLLSGYQSIFPMPVQERALLYYFIAARFCQLVMYSKRNLVEHPDHVDVQVCYNKYYGILRQFWSKTIDEVERIWSESAK